MDAPIALALIAKAKCVFEREDTFLSFPVVGQITYKPEDLSFLGGEVSTNLDLLKLSEFCRTVNLIPDGPVWPPAEECYLWNVLEDVMKANLQFATSTRTAEEEQKYQEAFHLLYEVGEDGLRRNSPMVQAHNRYRDAWFTARENYNIHKVEAELTDDPQVKVHWEEVLEPRLRADMDSVESNWRVEGFRDQVEEAQRVEAALGSKSPQNAWSTWDKMFDRNTDIQWDTSDQSFVPSGISPSNALQAAEWLEFTLTGAEASQLIYTAPEELRAKLSPNPVDLEIESISFECTSVAVSRPWLATELFRARFWKFPDPNQMLSDGLMPPSGLMPAYVAALVFARRPVVKLKENSERNRTILRSITAAKALSLGVFSVAPVSGQSVMRSAPRETTPTIGATAATDLLQPAQQARIQAAMRRMAVNSFSRLEARPDVRTARTGFGSAVTVRDHRSILARPERPADAVPIRRGFHVRLPFGSAPMPEAQPQPQPEPPAPDDSIYILAFICKRVPRCPDPDPSFHW